MNDVAREAHWIARDGWERLLVRGADARTWLHRILSNDVKSLAPDAGAWNLLLDDRGRVETLGLLLCEGTSSFAIWSEERQRATWREKLDFFLFSEQVELVLDDRLATVDLVGERASEVLRAMTGAEPPRERGAHRALRCGEIALQCIADGRGRVPAFVLAVPCEERAQLERALAASGAAPAGAAELAFLRVEDGLASFARDAADGVRPAEAALHFAFDLDKGCYPGQETVARMDTYGGPQKRLFGLELLGAGEPPAPGTRVLLDDVEIGRTGSAAREPGGARVLALALVAKRAWTPGREVMLASGARATLRELPFAR